VAILDARVERVIDECSAPRRFVIILRHYWKSMTDQLQSACSRVIIELISKISSLNDASHFH
jgi:hypothetical protein